MRLGTLTVLAAVLSAGPLMAQNIHPVPPPAVRAVPRTAPISVDGVLDEEIWRTAPAATDFLQSQPTEAAPATQRTEVRFAFDADAIYIGARMADSEGAAGVRTRLTRRDQAFDADDLTIIFDTFHDHLGRTQFSVNPSGVKGDAYGPGGAGADGSWDPIYEVRTRIDADGWTAEFRIPLSQLRFPNTLDEQTWGLQIVRFETRLAERSHWAFWRLNESGGPNRYGHLEGLALREAPRGLEVLPYLVGQQTRRGTVNAANPFTQENERLARVGMDLTYRLTSNLTLSATVNPDFGQVEVDPAVVNLGVFETGLSERRPFFVEGAGLFRFGGLNCMSCSNASGLSMLYSRRIGRFPQGTAAAGALGGYYDAPDNTAILGAAKITGRTAGGWSIAVLNAMTAREFATVQVDSVTRRNVEVEPFTNYFAARVARDLRGGATQVRAMMTSVVRDLSDSALADRLNRHSEVFGLELDNWFQNRRYRLMTMVAYAQAAGDTGAILRAQTSSARYFQRPDREHGGNGLFTDRYDPTLTSIRGLAAYTRFSKEGGDWLFDAQANMRTPGYEANDLAFNSRVDFVWFNGNLVRRWTRPTRWYRNVWTSIGGQTEFNFDGDRTSAPQVHGFWNITFPNFWYASMYGHVRSSRFDERTTRGGPVVKHPGNWFLNWSAGTDSRKSIVLNGFGWYSTNRERFLDAGVGLNATIRPASNVSLSVGPSWNHFISRTQYVTSVADTTANLFYDRRYVFADLDQVGLSMDTRINITFSPTLSFEAYIQPLLNSGSYSRFKEFAQPRSEAKPVYGVDFGTIRSDSAGYWLDPDGAAGVADSFRISRPDFTFRSLRGNAVVRWEFRPGSTLYLVATQARSASDGLGNMAPSRDLPRLFRAPGDWVFLVKVSWWVGM